MHERLASSGLQQFRGEGISFTYPITWEVVSEQSADEHVTVTVQSPDTAFCTFTIFVDQPSTRDVLKSVLEAYREEYPELDASKVRKGQLAGYDAQLQQVQFFAFDLVNTVELAALQAEGSTVLVVTQCTDHELEHYERVMQAITSTLVCEIDDEDLFD